jgi:sulfite reductase alpha subunit-like flavoprotein
MDEIRFNQQQEFTLWSVKLFEAMAAHTERNQAIVAHNKSLGFQDFDFNLVHAPFRLTFTNSELQLEPRSHYRENVLLATVISNELVNEDPTNLIYSMELNIGDGSPAFQAGDTFAVIPQNPAEEVAGLISRMGHNPTQVFLTQSTDSNGMELACSFGHNSSYFIDITSPPSIALLKFLGMHSQDSVTKRCLLRMLTTTPPSCGYSIQF